MSTLNVHGKPELLCFQHCDKNANIFCFQLPDRCPVCNTALATADLRIPPFRIALPLACAAHHPTSIVIRPTAGTFLGDFKNGDLLHVGITDSRSLVYEFDERGLGKTDGSSWKECLTVKIEDVVDSATKLDHVLESTTTSMLWTADKYDGNNHNCFDYCVSVLNEASHSKRWTKVDLVTETISPQLNKMIRMISLYRKAREHGVHVSNKF